DQVDQILDNSNNILTSQYFRILRDFQLKLAVNPVTAHISQIITFVREEQTLDNTPGSFLIRWFGVSQLPVDMFHSFLLRVGCILLKCIINNGIIRIVRSIFLSQND